MAGKKENIKALFTNTRSRVIIIFTLVILLIAILIGFFRFMRFGSGADLNAEVTTAPSIQSIPGALNPTAQYAKLQETQNENQASNALQSGGSSIPTIIRSQTIGSGVDVVGAKAGETGGVGFSGLNREDEAGQTRKNWISDLEKSNCSAATIRTVVKAGATLEILKKACTCTQLKASDYKAIDLQRVCDCSELKKAGFSAQQLKDIGYTVQRLRNCGFSACEVKAAGFSAQEMLEGGFSDGELKGAGFTDEQIARAAGIPDGMTAADIRKAGCDVRALSKLRAAGVKATAIRRINGCSPEQLKAAGYTAADLAEAGYPASALRSLFRPDELKKAGFNPRDLFNAGFNTKDVGALGFKSDDINSAENELPPGFNPDDIKNAGCGVEALKNLRASGVSAKSIKLYSNCTAAQLKKAGYSDQDLTNAGFTQQEIAKPDEEKEAGVTDAEIRAAGCDSQKLTALLNKGVSAKKIRQMNGCSLAALKAAGFDAKALSEAGFSPQELLAAGFSPEELQKAGIAPAGFVAAGRTANCSIAYLTAAHKAGVSANTIRKTLGCSAAAMKAAGYTAKELKEAGFTAGELKDAGFTANQLKAAGFSPKDLKDAGFTAKQLKDAGFSDNEIKSAGFSPEDLKAAGITSSEVAVLIPPPVEIKAPSNVPSIPVVEKVAIIQDANALRVKEMLNRQQRQLDEQKYQQKIQQRANEMLSAANQSIQEWKKVSTQVYIAGSEDPEKKGMSPAMIENQTTVVRKETTIMEGERPKIIVKTGDILFAVIDTSVNSDEPGPILATIVSGKLKGARLIGSFNLPPNADKMVITFNTLSIQGAAKSIPVNAYAIDPNTARTALSSRTNHHFLLRYGSLFASSFLEGIGNAYQSADTTVSVGGAGGNGNVTVQNGIDRTTLQNAIIALSVVGKSWGQAAQQLFSTPTTVEVYSGTGIGVLFTQDLTTI